MFCVIYQFEVRDGKANQFINAWKRLTELIYEFEGSLGSRLQLEKENLYIAYAQWPNRERWESYGSELPEEALVQTALMKEVCTKIETLHELEVIEDLLKPTTHPK